MYESSKRLDLVKNVAGVVQKRKLRQLIQDKLLNNTLMDIDLWRINRRDELPFIEECQDMIRMNQRFS